MILIQDESGEIYNKTNNPAVVFDKESGVYHKIGGYNSMKSYYEVARTAYEANGFQEMADNLILLELPKDQEIVDKVFQITGFLKTFYESEVLDKKGSVKLES